MARPENRSRRPWKMYFRVEMVSDFPKRRGREANTMFEFKSEIRCRICAVLST